MVPGLALLGPVAPRCAIYYCFCGLPIEQQETEEWVQEGWDERSRMKGVHLCRASRTVHDEASRKTWRDDVEQRSGVQQSVVRNGVAVRS